MQAKSNEVNEVPDYVLSEIRKISSKRCEGCWPGRKVAEDSPLALLKAELKGLKLSPAKMAEYSAASLDFDPAVQDQLAKTIAIVKKYQPNAGLHTDYRNLLANLDVELTAKPSNVTNKSHLLAEDSELTEAVGRQAGVYDFNL